MTTKIPLLLACLAWSLSLSAAEQTPENLDLLKHQIALAITKFEQTKMERWAYRVTRFENEEGDITTSTEAFTPHPEIDQQWALIETNGERPTKKQRRQFQKDKREQEKGSYTIKLRNIINQDSLMLKHQTHSHLEMSFDANLEKLGKDASDNLQGSLSYNKELGFIEHITIVNNAPFSPMFSANISEFRLTFDFASIENSILLQQQAMAMKGSFALFTEIDEVSTDTYTDYHYHGL